MRDELRRAALVTSGVVDLTRQKAEQIVRDLVKSGDVRRDQSSNIVKELLKRSSENRKELTRFVRSELKNQIEGLGLATKRDLERLERRIGRLEDARKATTTQEEVDREENHGVFEGEWSDASKSSVNDSRIRFGRHGSRKPGERERRGLNRTVFSRRTSSASRACP